MTEKRFSSFSGYEAQFGMSPQEAPALMRTRSSKLFIGVPKEKTFQEKRVALTPESVSILVSNGHRVMIETKAGKGAHFTDNDYSEAGAEIVENHEQVFEAEIVLKVAPLSEDEISLLKMHQILISPIHLPTLSADYIQKLMAKKITALAIEYMKD